MVALNISSYRLGENKLAAIQVDTGILGEIPMLRPLRMLFDYWYTERINNNVLPERIEADVIEQSGMIGNMHLYDVSPAEPLDYRVIYWGRNAAIDGYRDGTFRVIRDFEPLEYAMWAASGVHRVKAHARPALEYVMSQSVTATATRYRMLLPLARDGVTVDRVASAWVYDGPTAVDLWSPAV